MPNYTNLPPKDASGTSLPILRTPANGLLKACVTSDDLIGTNTHFWGGHTVPCTPPDCEACKNGVPYRWHAYLTAIHAKKCLHFLYEMTAPAAEIFIAYRAKHKVLRRCIFEAYRWRSSANGRVMLHCQPHPGDDIVLPPAPNLEAVLAILWQLPKDNVQETATRSFGRNIEVNPHVPGQNGPSNPRKPVHDKP